MTIDQSHARAILNSAGYLFQLRVKHEIETSKSEHSWRVRRHEHPWRLKGTNDEGFADLVLEIADRLLVIECKRYRENALWVFPVAEGQGDRLHVRCQHIRLAGTKFEGWWGDDTVLPRSPEAEFCVLHGQSERHAPMLETVARKLLVALEAIAVEEVDAARLRRGSQPRDDFERILIPVIVTSARLVVARIRVEDVSLSDGTVSEGSFDEVPLVRFRKNLTTERSALQTEPWREVVRSESERTILVVSAMRIAEVLKDLGSGLG